MHFYELSGDVTYLRKFRNQIILQSNCTDQTAQSCIPGTIKLNPGFYQFECWGANSNSAHGGYTKGCLYIKNQTTLYLYIGKNYHLFNAAPPHNYSNVQCYYPSGATDIRLSDGLYSEFESLKTRIMVAAGAGASDWKGYGGFGGGLIGGTGNTTSDRDNNPLSNVLTTGGTQTSGGYFIGTLYDPSIHFIYYGFNGSFGIGGYSNSIIDGGAFGGGGYYGGAGRNWFGASGGGSSFISGHPGCDAIAKNSTEKEIVHTGQPIHYSHIFFGDTVMKSGNESMPEFREGENKDGMIRIKYIRNPFHQPSFICKHSNTFHYALIFTLYGSSE